MASEKTLAKARFNSVKSVAQQFDVSTRTVVRWVESGDLIAHKLGHLIRISDEDLRAFVALRRDAIG